MTVDATDLEIWQPKPFNKKWYSHKFHGPGLRYEIGVCIQTGDIVWVSGPYMCGRWPDINIFRDGLKNWLLPGEMVEADGGYRGDEKVRNPTNVRNHAELMKKKAARVRHETINGCLKNWGVLNQTYRHGPETHCDCFMAVAVLTQLTFNRGNRPYQVNY
jgi:hypothetical protein